MKQLNLFHNWLRLREFLEKDCVLQATMKAKMKQLERVSGLTSDDRRARHHQAHETGRISMKISLWHLKIIKEVANAFVNKFQGCAMEVSLCFVSTVSAPPAANGLTMFMTNSDFCNKTKKNRLLFVVTQFDPQKCSLCFCAHRRRQLTQLPPSLCVQITTLRTWDAASTRDCWKSSAIVFNSSVFCFSFDAFSTTLFPPFIVLQS